MTWLIICIHSATFVLLFAELKRRQEVYIVHIFSVLFAHGSLNSTNQCTNEIHFNSSQLPGSAEALRHVRI